MESDYTLPFFAQTTWIIGIFVGSLIAFHCILVGWLKLGKVAWKKVDYIWLAFGAIGIFASVEVPRNFVGGNLTALAESRMIGMITRLNMEVEIGKGPGFCRVFVPSEYSPPKTEFARIQKEHDAVCNWFNLLAKTLPTTAENVKYPISLTALPILPVDGGETFARRLKALTQSIEGVNQQLAVIEELRASKKRNSMEEALQLLGPLLLAVAIALRITKVTGEIANEK